MARELERVETASVERVYRQVLRLPKPVQTLAVKELIRAVIALKRLSDALAGGDPILAVAPIRQALLETRVPVIAVSPIVAGDAVKGPTAKIMRELGLEISADTVSRHYGDLLDGMLIDARDPPTALDLPHARADTLMKTLEDRIRVARAALELADSLRS